MWGERFLLEMEQFPHRLVQLSSAEPRYHQPCIDPGQVIHAQLFWNSLAVV